MRQKCFLDSTTGTYQCILTSLFLGVFFHHTFSRQSTVSVKKRSDLVFLILDVEEQGPEFGAVFVSCVAVDFVQLLLDSQRQPLDLAARQHNVICLLCPGKPQAHTAVSLFKNKDEYHC